LTLSRFVLRIFASVESAISKLLGMEGILATKDKNALKQV
jgi:hypothetical protein